LFSTNVRSEQVTALGILTARPRGILYYGTKSGVVKRVDGANSGSSPTVIDISSGLPVSGYDNYLAVKPTDSVNVIAVFIKYNLQSLWYSTYGRSIVWFQEALSFISNTVTAMLDWRDNDGTLAVATRGKGVYSATAASPLPVELCSFSGILQNG